MEEKTRAAEVIGKVVVSEESGRKFGVVGNIEFVVESGELINIVLEQPTKYATEINLRKNEKGKLLIPFTAIKSIGDFVVVSESELV